MSHAAWNNKIFRAFGAQKHWDGSPVPSSDPPEMGKLALDCEGKGECEFGDGMIDKEEKKV